MELQFLGTSSGTPTKTRNVSGLALRPPHGGYWVLVDCGEGTQHRILHTPHSLVNLRAIFITHVHGDHCYGLPGLLASAGMLNRTAELVLVGPPAVFDFVRGVMASTALELPYPLRCVSLDELTGGNVLPDLEVSTCALSHRVPSYAYAFTERQVEHKLDVAKLERAGIARGPAWGRLQQGEDVVLDDGTRLRPHDFLLPLRSPRKIVVGGDNDTPSLLADLVRDAQVLVHEATYTEAVLRKVGPEPQHSSALRLARFAQDAQVPNLVLTHFSARYQDWDRGPSLADLEAEARSAYAGRVFLARDLARWTLDRDGVLTPVAEKTLPT